MTEIKELFMLRAAVASEALKNPDFLDKLRADPSAALSEFTGHDFSRVNIVIAEEDSDEITFPIAKVPEVLTADQLEAVAGGAFFVATAATVGTVAGVVGGAAAGAGAAYTVGKSEDWW